MPGPADLLLFTFVAYQRQAVADDTEFFVRYVDPAAGDTLQGAARATADIREPWKRLHEMGLCCEEAYLRWRVANPRSAIGASCAVRDSAWSQVEDLASRTAFGLVSAGHRRLTAGALRQAEDDYGYAAALSVMRRAAKRCRSDSRDYDAERIREMCDVSNEMFVEPGDAKIDYQRIRRAVAFPGWNELPSVLDLRGTETVAYGAPDRNRKAIKRSVKIAERFAGAETTRLFISGETVRITGRLASYQLKRQGGLMHDHGAAALSVHDRETGAYLCKLCTYTPGVPLLDHVAGIFIRVKADDETDILTTGNPYDVAPEARDQPWLVPFLDRDRTPVRDERERDGRDLPTRALVRDLGENLRDEIGNDLPPMPYTWAVLSEGVTKAEMHLLPGRERTDLLAEAERECLPVAGDVTVATRDHFEGVG